MQSSKTSFFRIIDHITWKPDWQTKLEDRTIVNKWKEECKKQLGESGSFEAALLMLKSMANKDMNDLHSMICHKKDLIPTDIKNKFYAAVNALDESAAVPDYHPGSDNMVIDLVHPSLYCYVRGTSLFKGSLSAPVKSEFIRYQWLPSEFRIDGQKKSKICSYINNLDEINHKPLYESIESIFDCFIPMFESVTGDQLTNKNCQVIVKLANIVVDRTKPIYQGGSWHVEGVPYENIIATGIYYYDIFNISDSYLEFRKGLEDPKYYEQDDEDDAFKKYGLKDGDELNKYLGKVKTEENNCLVFPNYLQHHVTEFALKDTRKLKQLSGTGHRKILVFFLINPKTKVPSTATVPIQQRHILKNILINTDISNILPNDMIENILNHCHLMSSQDALDYRLQLMETRKRFVEELNDKLFENTFSLCEH